MAATAWMAGVWHAMARLIIDQHSAETSVPGAIYLRWPAC
jgi:hypothetical protein